MFGSVILDVAIGLVLVYLLLSLIASAIREAVEAFVKSRAVHLERGVRTLLDDPRGDGLAKAVYEHPLVYSLYQDDFVPAVKRFRGRNLPTYIPSRNFARAVLDLAVRPPVPSVYAAQQTGVGVSMEALRASVGRIQNAAVQRTLRSAIDEADGDVRRVQASVEAWYDSAMDRVSGWYKRRTQGILLGIGLAVAVVIDVDTVRIAQHLYRDPGSRAAAVAMAGHLRADSVGGAASAEDARTSLARLDTLGLPILWKGVPRAARPIGAHALDSLLGWIVTALAVSLGAPFWFDTLNRIMVIRSTVKPHEKSPEESSEDRQAPKRTPDARDLATLAGAAAAAGVAASTTAPPNPVTVPITESPHTPHEWADGIEDGIL